MSFPIVARLFQAGSLARRMAGRAVATSTVALLASMWLTRVSAAESASEDGWIQLFNGKDLTGWTVKVSKHPLGVNYGDTFRVEDGVIKVAYDKYASFDMQFAHLYTNHAYSRYVLRLEYRFTGTAPADAPHWAKLNSGVMLHCQSPLSLRLDQAFPVSMEFQFLTEGATAGKQTGNVCSPGTHLELNGAVNTTHVIDAKGKLSPFETWVAVEVEVRGNEEIIHRVEGVEVMRYQRPQLDARDRDGKAMLDAGVPLLLSSGHIALQAESQPVWFRNVRLKPLP